MRGVVSIVCDLHGHDSLTFPVLLDMSCIRKDLTMVSAHHQHSELLLCRVWPTPPNPAKKLKQLQTKNKTKKLLPTNGSSAEGAVRKRLQTPVLKEFSKANPFVAQRNQTPRAGLLSPMALKMLQAFTAQSKPSWQPGKGIYRVGRPITTCDRCSEKQGAVNGSAAPSSTLTNSDAL